MMREDTLWWVVKDETKKTIMVMELLTHRNGHVKENIIDSLGYLYFPVKGGKRMKMGKLLFAPCQTSELTDLMLKQDHKGYEIVVIGANA